ncbi:GFA family protein [Pelagerythrobacter sp.]|uniref:GFA family protein n=1 Tax=Pelagerythrobacter sp. TaxID=2800702 RepID=UPI0035B1E3FF
MPDPVSFDPPLEGRCLCGAVTITLARVAPGVEACHCAMCRRWCSGPFFSLHGAKHGEFALSGEEAVHSYPSSEWAERASCATCGSALWYRFIPGETWAFAAGLFDLPADWRIGEQIFVDEMPDWAELAADGPRKTGAQIMAEAKAAGFDFG